MSIDTTSPKTLLITGATGFVGGRLATLAGEQGFIVRTFTRSDWVGIPAVPVQNRFFGSLPASISEEVLRGVDCVVHCAAELSPDEKRSYAVNAEGTARLVAMARAVGVRTFVFLSSQSARPDALSAYGKTKYAAEELLRGVDDINVVILRPGLVIGPGSRGLFRRMTDMVESLPIIPLLAGGRSIVQPIHVDDLCSAILACCALGRQLRGAILNVGDIEGITLAELLQAIAVARFGHRKPMLSIPLWPIQVALRLTEKLRIPLPINTNNLLGLKMVEKMDTGPDMRRLGITLRPLDRALHSDPVSCRKALTLQERATKAILVGAGRIGLVHAVTLSRLGGVKLCGLVDPNARATGLLLGMGVPTVAYRSLNDALLGGQPDTAVIATPAGTHLSLTRDCLKHGLAVMVEKPLAIRREHLDDYERLLVEYPQNPVQVGYVMLRTPHVVSCIAQLRAGDFGNVVGFMGLSLLTLVQKAASNRWEVKRDLSGGGVFINSGGHVLSMIWAAFGSPAHIEAESIRLFSREVEDSLVVRYSYPEFSGVQYCSWSIQGYSRQENRLIVQTDRGWLIVTGSLGMFLPYKGNPSIIHQLDFDLGFNIAPDYVGGGFTTELIDLCQAALTRQPAPMDLRKGIDLERLLFRVYDQVREVKAFSLPRSGVEYSGQLSSPNVVSKRDGLKRVLDLRDLATPDILTWLDRSDGSRLWDEFQLTSTQTGKLASAWPDNERLRITVPDFLNQSRLLSNGHYLEVLRRMGIGGMVGAALGASALVISERGLTFWVAAVGLLAAGLRSVPVKFRGTLLLHSYLTDLALSLGRLDILERMIKMCHHSRPLARVGFHSNMAGEALNALWLLGTSVDEVSVLTSPNAQGIDAKLTDMRRAITKKGFRLTAEVGLAPYTVHQWAMCAPDRWAHGADAVLIGPGADPHFAAQRRREVRRDWISVFPGLDLPGGVL